MNGCHLNRRLDELFLDSELWAPKREMSVLGLEHAWNIFPHVYGTVTKPAAAVPSLPATSPIPENAGIGEIQVVPGEDQMDGIDNSPTIGSSRILQGVDTVPLSDADINWEDIDETSGGSGGSCSQLSSTNEISPGLLTVGGTTLASRSSDESRSTESDVPRSSSEVEGTLTRRRSSQVATQIDRANEHCPRSPSV